MKKVATTGILAVLIISFLLPLTPSHVQARGVTEETVARRDLVIQLDKGLSTDAQLTFPAAGSGPFPGVLLVQGSGTIDMDEYLPPGATGLEKPSAPFVQIAEYLSARGFAVLRYNKRYVGAKSTLLDPEGWATVTFQDLKQDAETALKVLIEQPEVDADDVTIIGHSEGAIIAPRVAVENTGVKNIVLMGATSQDLREVLYFQLVEGPTLYAEDTIDTNHDELLSIEEVYETREFGLVFLPASMFIENSTGQWLWQQGFDTDEDGYLSIQEELKPWLVKRMETYTTSEAIPMHKYLQSIFALEDTLDMIGNVSASILILQGEGDIQTPVEQAYLLEQRLTETNHPDHTLITYPGLGHTFYPADGWNQPLGPIQEYVLSDLASWLKDPARKVRYLTAEIKANADEIEQLNQQVGELEKRESELKSRLDITAIFTYGAIGIAVLAFVIAGVAYRKR